MTKTYDESRQQIMFCRFLFIWRPRWPNDAQCGRKLRKSRVRFPAGPILWKYSAALWLLLIQGYKTEIFLQSGGIYSELFPLLVFWVVIQSEICCSDTLNSREFPSLSGSLWFSYLAQYIIIQCHWRISLPNTCKYKKEKESQTCFWLKSLLLQAVFPPLSLFLTC